jgi:hypothetical protein
MHYCGKKCLLVMKLPLIIHLSKHHMLAIQPCSLHNSMQIADHDIEGRVVGILFIKAAVI